MPANQKRNWIKGAIKHPGALTARAKRNGRTVSQEVAVDLKSKNAHIRAQGQFAKNAKHFKHHKK